MIYTADTGYIDDKDGDKYQNGRIYKFDLSELLKNQFESIENNLSTLFSIILDGDLRDDIIRNPDNLATSKKA